MRKQRKTLWFLVMALFSSSLNFTVCAAYKRKKLNTEIYLSPRSLGRGHTYITTASGQDALFLNPALIPMPKRGIYDRTYLLDPTVIGSMKIMSAINEITSSSLMNVFSGDIKTEDMGGLKTEVDKLVRDLAKEPLSAYASFFFGSFFRYVGFGVLGSISADVDGGRATVKSSGQSLQGNVLATAAPSIAFAYPVLRDLKIGLAARYLIRLEANLDVGTELQDLLKFQDKDEISKLTDMKSLLAFDHKPAFDAGIVYSPRVFLSPRFGLVFANMGNVNFKDQDGIASFKMEPLRQDLGFGASIHPKLGPGVLSVSLDFRDILGSYDTSFLAETYFGVDYLIKEMFGLSAGLSQGYPSANLYFTSRYFQADLGVYTKERGIVVGQKPDPRFFFKMSFSF